ncbi:hypothetical protein HY469_05280 [Candidatus Roizmanbacteria bacterium]|nr:hypothetical protein [Candidatus Roizmanbacteria bacterium]
MQKVLELIKQRRVWAGIIGVVVFVFAAFNFSPDIDAPVVTDMLTAIGVAVASLVQAVLALWSYLRPKQP